MLRMFFVVLILAAAPANAGCAKKTEKLKPIRNWHTSYLVVSNIDYSWIYAMSSDGKFKIYRPSRVDANDEPCSHQEKRDGLWCVADGRLYRAGSEIVAKSSNGMDGLFYLTRDGRVCAFPDEEDDFRGQCEYEGYKEAMSLFSTYPSSR